MRSKCFTNKNGTRCKGEKVVEILQSPLPPPPHGNHYRPHNDLSDNGDYL